MCGCGGGKKTPTSGATTGGGRVVGYAVKMPDGRTATYLTRSEAEAAAANFGATQPVKPMYG